MFSNEWEIKSTTKLPQKEAHAYKETITHLAFPYAKLQAHGAAQSASSSAGQKGSGKKGDAPAVVVTAGSEAPAANLNVAQKYALDVCTSLARRTAAFFLPEDIHNGSGQITTSPTTQAGADDAGGESPSLKITDAHVTIADAWTSVLFDIMASELPESCVVPAGTSAGSLLVEKNSLKDVSGKSQNGAVAFQANGICLSFYTDDQYHNARPHQFTLFFYLRIRYLLEKILLRHTAKLIKLAEEALQKSQPDHPLLSPYISSSSSSSSSTSAAVATNTSSASASVLRVTLKKAEKRFRRHLHHALFLNLVLSRPCLKLTPKEEHELASALPSAASSLIVPAAVMMTTNEIATKYILEGRTLMGPAVGALRLATRVPSHCHSVLLTAMQQQSGLASEDKQNLGLVAVAPGQAFPFAVGMIGADLYSDTLNCLKRMDDSSPTDRSEFFYFGEERQLQYFSSSASSANAPRLGLTLYPMDLVANEGGVLGGPGFIPTHVAYDGLWELFWPSYSSNASRSDGVHGDWLTPDDLQFPTVKENESLVFDLETGRQAMEEERSAKDGTVVDDFKEVIAPRMPPIPSTHDECLQFALAESLKELNQRRRGLIKCGQLSEDQPLKMPIITVVGLYLKRHTPRIPMALRSVELGGGKPTVAVTEAKTETASAHKEDGSDDEDEEGEKKLSKAEKMMKRKAEKEAKNAEKKGGKASKGGKDGKKGGGKSTAHEEEGADAAGAASSPISDEEDFTNTAIELDFKHSSYKKSTAFFKAIAEETGGAFFTLPNDNEIAINYQKKKIPSTAADLLNEHKRNYGKFMKIVHLPLINMEEERKAEEEFALIGSEGAAASDAKGSANEMLEDEAKATVSDISVLTGFNRSVNSELKRILTGHWRPTTEGDKTAGDDNSDVDEGEEANCDPEDEAAAIAEVMAAPSAGGSMNVPDPIALPAIVTSAGDAVFSKASLFRNLKYYVVKKGLFKPSSIAVVQQQSPSGGGGVSQQDPFPALGGATTAANEPSSPFTATPSSAAAGVPVWQRALLKREADRAAAAKQKAEEEEKAKEAQKEKEAEATKAASNSQQADGPLMVHLDDLLIQCMRVAKADYVMDMATFLNSFAYRLLVPQTRITVQSPHRVKHLWIKSKLPRIVIREKKRAGNRMVVYVCGVQDFGLNLKALCYRWRREMACSVAIEAAPPAFAVGIGSTMCLVLTGKVRGLVVSSLERLGVPSSCIA